MLKELGVDTHDPHIADTPKRWAESLLEMTDFYSGRSKPDLRTFPDEKIAPGQIVTVKDIPVYSQCAHHILPFFGKASIAYIPGSKILGLSKVARLVKYFSRALQVQERLTSQIASYLEESLKPAAIVVVLKCRHLCMEQRGVERPAFTITAESRGKAQTDQGLRQEMLQILGFQNGAV